MAVGATPRASGGPSSRRHGCSLSVRVLQDASLPLKAAEGGEDIPAGGDAARMHASDCSRSTAAPGDGINALEVAIGRHPSLGHHALHRVERSYISAKFFTHLKTMQRSVCDGDLLHIKCPRNTSITFNTVFYGRNASYSRMCPGGAGQGGLAGGRGGQGPADDTTCIWKGALPLLVEACKNQQECKVNPHKEFRQRDPCPHIKKATDVSYQCRPNLFLYKTVCQGEKMSLKCQGKQRRLLVFSAFFGATRLGVPECHQQEDLSKECNAVGATDAMIAECQGRRRCQLSASQERFGRILCAKQAAVFLRVVYTCVSRDILKEYDNDDEDFTTDDSLISSTTSLSPTSSTAAPNENFVLTSPPNPSERFVTNRPRPPFSEHNEGGKPSFSSGRESSGADPGFRHGPPLVRPGTMGSSGREAPGSTAPSIIYNVPKPGSAGDAVRLHEVIDGSSGESQLGTSMPLGRDPLS
ncbi:hypothetical protein BIW11_07430, partial [Tropilaelaps mercedesae]